MLFDSEEEIKQNTSSPFKYIEELPKARTYSEQILGETNLLQFSREEEKETELETSGNNMSSGEQKESSVGVTTMNDIQNEFSKV